MKHTKNSKLHNKLAAKLKSRAGESLVEILCSILIISVSMMMLATSISSSSKNVKLARSQMDTYYTGNNILSAGITDTDLDGVVATGTRGTIVLDKTIFWDGTSSTEKTKIKVYFYGNSVFEDNSVIAYTKIDE